MLLADAEMSSPPSLAADAVPQLCRRRRRGAQRHARAGRATRSWRPALGILARGELTLDDRSHRIARSALADTLYRRGWRWRKRVHRL